MTGLHHRGALPMILMPQELQRIAVGIEQSCEREDEFHPQNPLVAVSREVAEADHFGSDHLPEPDIVDEKLVCAERIDTDCRHNTTPQHFSMLSPRGLCVRNRTHRLYRHTEVAFFPRNIHKYFREVPLELQRLAELRSALLLFHKERS